MASRRPEHPRVRIVIADDHAIVRRGLRQLLEEEADFEVVAEAAGTDTAVRFVQGHRPDVLVLDLNMPGGPAIPAIGRLHTEHPGTRIVVLTMESDPSYARAALSAGALGYVLKESADGELVEAVRAAMAGEAFMNPRLGARLASEPSGPPDGLTGRELEILRLLAIGKTNSQIAEDLFLSVRTIETHRAHLQRKLHLNNRAELVRYALDRGLVN